MADPGEPDDGPSLEMPAFSLRRRKPASERAEPPTATPAVEAEPGPDRADEPVRRREPRRLPPVALTGLPAAAVTGVVVGVLAVLLAWLAGAGCSAVRGTSSCGGATGLPLLLAGLVLLAWAGSLLLRALGVADARSTSVLAVGIMAVLVMVFLLGSLDEWWALVAVPLAAAVGYGASWWVTSSVVGDNGEAPVPRDVR
ncbi:hypothetical protein GCM10009641_60870 [Mycobacterium cookii]|uniref:Integral membrane protein n=1 Tax=Nocardioides furvisabuli TaxID=375542 RepID=A0ABP5IZ34_9ACTN|nr:hypothetical protein [Nocardioides furvisabuli]